MRGREFWRFLALLVLFAIGPKEPIRGPHNRLWPERMRQTENRTSGLISACDGLPETGRGSGESWPTGHGLQTELQNSTMRSTARRDRTAGTSAASERVWCRPRYSRHRSWRMSRVKEEHPTRCTVRTYARFLGQLFCIERFPERLTDTKATGWKRSGGYGSTRGSRSLPGTPVERRTQGRFLISPLRVFQQKFANAKNHTVG